MHIYDVLRFFFASCPGVFFAKQNTVTVALKPGIYAIDVLSYIVYRYPLETEKCNEGSFLYVLVSVEIFQVRACIFLYDLEI